jgi:hypothetical protein
MLEDDLYGASHSLPPVDDTGQHTLVSFAAPVPVRPRRRPQRSDCELGHGEIFIVELILILNAAQAPAAVNEDLDDDSEMWKMFLNEVKEEDIRFTDAWKEDANSIVTFVSHNLLGPCVRLNDKLQDRPFLRNCWCIHH